MKQIIKNIFYDETLALDGDLFLPESAGHAPCVLLIHGGGWGAMDRHSLDGIALFLQDNGFAVYNIEYRLSGVAKWPACGDDCLNAFQFFQNTDRPEFSALDRKQISVIGASAGGHLSLMTGLRAPAERVGKVISISGITDMDVEGIPPRYSTLFADDVTDAERIAASPTAYIRKDMPPTLLTHCPVDKVVKVANAEVFDYRSQKCGARSKFFCYERPQDGHCIWIPGSNPHKLFPELEAEILTFLRG